jgi:hypothetical protein
LLGELENGADLGEYSLGISLKTKHTIQQLC